MAQAALLDRPAGATAAGREGGPPVPLIPFVRASRERTELADDRSTQIQTSSRAVGPLDVPASGFLRFLVLQVEATGGAQGAAVVAATEDAPFAVFDDITLSDVNGNPIFGPLNGYHAYLAEKYGAYSHITDARQLPSFSGVAATGNFAFTLRIPIEISPRDALGALANQSASQTYKLRYSIAPSSSIYTTAPATTLPTVRVRAWLEAWAQPRPENAFGQPQEESPPAHGTTQYWSSAVYNLNAGEQTIRLTRMGNLVRTIVAILRSGGARTDANFPDPIRFEYDGSLIEQVSRGIFIDRIVQRYGFVAAANVANGRDTGVFVWEFTHDLDGKPGYELRDLYLPTTQATRLDLRGSFTGANTLTVLTNDVAVPAGRSVFKG